VKTKINAKVLNSFEEKLLGLMFQDEIFPICFETRFGIHTFFVKHRIDIVILDKDCKVRAIREGLKPWRFFFWNPQYFLVLEMPLGYIKKFKIKYGKILQFDC